MAADWIVRSLACDYSPGHRMGDHDHDWHQLAFAESGAMYVAAASEEWFVPPSMALWIPAHTTHDILAQGVLALRTLYFRPDQIDKGERRVLAVTPFLRELIRRVVALGMLDGARQADRAYATILAREIADAQTVALHLRAPKDQRGARAAALIAREPISLEEAARRAGASARTLQRIFLQETGLPFAKWRQQRRLLAAIESLAQGQGVAAAAEVAGYSSTSAFVAAFQRQFGATPGRWAQARRER